MNEWLMFFAIFSNTFLGQIHLPLTDRPLVKLSLKTFFVFHSNSMKLVEVLVHIDNYNFTNFHWIQKKNKKGFFYETFNGHS